MLSYNVTFASRHYSSGFVNAIFIQLRHYDVILNGARTICLYNCQDENGFVIF